MLDLLLLLIPLAFVIFVVYKWPELLPFGMILAAILVCLVERMNVLECSFATASAQWPSLPDDQLA